MPGNKGNKKGKMGRKKAPPRSKKKKAQNTIKVNSGTY